MIIIPNLYVPYNISAKYVKQTLEKFAKCGIPVILALMGLR